MSKHFFNASNLNHDSRCPRQVFEELRNSSERLIERHGIQATRLCTHKDDVEQMNSLSLKNLKGETKLFVSVDSDWSLSDQMDKFLPVMQKLELKVGAQVIFYFFTVPGNLFLR